MCHTHLRARRCDLWGRQWDQLLLSGDQIFTPGRQTAQMRNWCNGCISWDEGMWRLGRVNKGKIGVNFQSRAWQQRSSQGSSFTDVVLENIETSKALHFNCDNYLFQFSFPMEPFNTMMHIHKGNFISCFGWFASKYQCWLVVNQSWSYLLLKVCWLNAESLDNKVRVSFAKMWTNWAGAGARATVNLFFFWRTPNLTPKQHSVEKR